MHEPGQQFWCIFHLHIASGIRLGSLTHGVIPWADAEIKVPQMGAQGYQRVPLSKPGVCQNIALHAVPADRTSTYLVSAFVVHSTSFYYQTSLIINSKMCRKQ